MITIPYKTKIESNKFVSFGVEFDRYTIDYLKRMSKDTITKDNFNSFTRSKSFSKLPFSDEEAEEVANLMNGKSWTNINATKSSFIENTNNADIIHVATHSYLDIEHPERSKLVFNKTRDTLDNFLTANEIYDLEFDAHLITLSACNSAYGQINNGEGINSLARAFYVSGIPSMTATLWSISDESTMIIMKSYYQFLNEGFTKDIALQKAQLAYLENDDISSPSFRMPIYWAAWKSIGNDNPIAINKKHTYRFTYLAIVLIGILLLYFLKKNNFN